MDKMDKESYKINYQSFIFQLNFKTDYCLEMTVTDKIQGRKYQNKNVEFTKLKRHTIVSALQEKNNKEIKCKVTETVVQGNPYKTQNSIQKDRQRCLCIEFFVEMNYILPFSEKAIVYEMDSYKKVSNMIPVKLSEQKAKQIKKQIEQVDSCIPSGQEFGDLRIEELSSISLLKQPSEIDKELIFFIASNVTLIILWFTYLTFWQYLLGLALLMGLIYLYCAKQRFTINQTVLKKGLYKIDVTGTMVVLNYNNTQNDSFVMHASFSRWESKRLKIPIRSQYSYGYPFNGCFLIESEKEQTLRIQFQKNVKIYSVNMNNVVITVQKLPPLLKSIF